MFGRRYFHSISTGVVFLMMLTAGTASGNDSATEPGGDLVAMDYARDVLPILSRNCFTCHGPDEASRESGLRLDQAETAFAETEGGSTAIVPGDPSSSELFIRVTSGDPELVMPPTTSGHQLTAAQIDILRSWIAQGAKFDTHWSLRPITNGTPPEVGNRTWPRNAIDHFVLDRLEQEGLAPSVEADRPTLIRRLSFDLLGLPPTVDEIASFQSDSSPDAYERLVDRMLASPHFGERWGRYWLDLAHFADSDGYLGDALRPHAWVYRDWLIDAINRDLPFDEFTIEQLAGDLLPSATLSQRVATGFLRNTLRNTEAGVDLEEYRLKEIVDRVNTIGVGWLGLTLGCAECHSHKYDPISQREFYQIFSFFNDADDIDIPIPEPEGPSKTEEDQHKTTTTKAPTTKAMTIAARKSPRHSYVHLRGDYRNRGEPVQPGTPVVLPPLASRTEKPDRLDFARWLVASDNPLVPRVAVNQIWQQLFDRGLVSPPDNFGVAGQGPSHPELLDWLAHHYAHGGWSRKAMIRLIVTSATYRQTSAHRPDLQRLDPENVLLARQSRFRLDAENIRDAALTVADSLWRRIGGPSIRPPQPAYITSISRNAQWPVSTGPDLYRRGVYILLRRATPYPTLLTFDAPDSTAVCVRRERSNSPLQALTLLNDPVFFEAARTFGLQLAASNTQTVAERLREAFERCCGRQPKADELARLHRFWEERLAAYQADLTNADALLQSESSTTDKMPEIASQNQAEQAAWVLTARVLMNLDLFMTRE